jgi:hypothetical protein
VPISAIGSSGNAARGGLSLLTSIDVNNAIEPTDPSVGDVETAPHVAGKLGRNRQAATDESESFRHVLMHEEVTVKSGIDEAKN